MLRVVNLILGSYIYGIEFFWVAALAYTLVKFNSLLSLFIEIQQIIILFLYFCSFLIDLYIQYTYSWFNCCYGFPSVNMAVLLLINSVILYNFSISSVFNIYTIITSSPEYRFYSNLALSMIEKVFNLSLLYLGGYF